MSKRSFVCETASGWQADRTAQMSLKSGHLSTTVSDNREVSQEEHALSSLLF